MKSKIRKLLNKKYIYKIYDKKKKLFSDGGLKPTFSKTGKTYNSLADVRKHKTQLFKINSDVEKNCVIVEIKIKVKKIKII